MPEAHDNLDRAYSGRDVRGGEVILTTRRRRLIFVGGLIAAALFALAATILPAV